MQQPYTTTVDTAATASGALSVNLSSTMSQTSVVEYAPITIQSAPTPAVSYVVNWGDGTTGGGWIAAEADVAGVPGTSSLNYGKGQTISNTVIVPVAANGKIELYNGGSTAVDLLADVSGYFSAAAPDAYVPVTPTRVWDTRQLSGWTLGSDSSEPAWLEGDNGDAPTQLFPTGATLVANTTVTNAKGSGYLSVYPSGASRPATSNVNFGTGQTVADLAILGTTGPSQGVTVYNGSTGSADVIFDVFGYFANN